MTAVSCATCVGPRWVAISHTVKLFASICLPKLDLVGRVPCIAQHTSMTRESVQVTGTAVWPRHDRLVQPPLEVVSPLATAPAFAAIRTPEELQAALRAGARHIVLRTHIDLTPLTANGVEIQLPLWTDSIRVRVRTTVARTRIVARVLSSSGTHTMWRYGQQVQKREQLGREHQAPRNFCL
jgi:hypothetical protein